jgi:hypothetical protein
MLFVCHSLRLTTPQASLLPVQMYQLRVSKRLFASAQLQSLRQRFGTVMQVMNARSTQLLLQHKQQPLPARVLAREWAWDALRRHRLIKDVVGQFFGTVWSAFGLISYFFSFLFFFIFLYFISSNWLMNVWWWCAAHSGVPRRAQ